MRILLVNQPWAAFGGSETYLLTIAPQLQRLGHDVELLATGGGEPVEMARGRGIQVATQAVELTEDPDVVLTQDSKSAYEMAERYPSACRVYIIHTSVFEPQRPPQLPNVCHAVVALNDGMRHQAEAAGVLPRILRLRQPVDLQRFTDRGGLGQEPQRVLLLGNHWGGPGYRNYRVVADACTELGLELEHVGAGGRVSTVPEIEIAAADIVVGIGRCAIEAMASARAAYVFGITGGGGWVTPESYEEMEARGFAGGSRKATVDAARFRRDLERFDPDMGQVNRQLAIANHDAHRHAAALVKLFRELEPTAVAESNGIGALSRLVRVQAETEGRVALAETDSRRLRAEAMRLRAEVMRLRVETDDLRLLLGKLLAGRRYRIGKLLASPLELGRRWKARRRGS